MRQYQLKETKEITKIICNRCGKRNKSCEWDSEKRDASCRAYLGLFFWKRWRKLQF